MLDPSAIGTLIIMRNAEASKAVDPEQRAAKPKRSGARVSGLPRSLARSLRSVADRLELSSE